MDQCHGTHPYVDICPRCSVRSQLILGLVKTAPVCINCAIDPTWTNPQENWGQGGVVMLQGQEFQGDIGPSRIIIQQPSYTVFEQLHGDKELVILNNHSRRAFLLPRRNGKAFDMAKSQMPNVSLTQPKKPSMQNVGRLAEAKKTSKSYRQVHSRPDTLKSTKILKQNKAKQIGGNQPSILKRDKYHSGNNGIAMANSSMLNNVNLAKSRLAQKWTFHEFSGSQYEAMMNAHKADANQIGMDHNLPSPGLFCYALTNNSQNNPVDFANNCCVQDCRANWIPNQYISQIQAEAMTVYAPHAKSPIVRIGAEHTVPPEGAFNWQFRVTPENIQPVESANQSNHNLSSCYPNSTFCCELDKQDALPRLATLSELNRTPKCANDWSYSVERNNISQTGTEIPSSKPYQTHIRCSNNPMTLVDPVIHKQVELSQAIKSTCCMTTREKQMNTATLANQNLENWHSTKPLCSEFVNTQPLPQRTTSTEQVDLPNEPVDLTYKFSTKTIHAQHDAAKPSNQDSGRLYPFSLNSDLVIAESSSTSAVQAKPLEERLDMAYKMARQENCTQIEAEEPKQQVLWDLYPYSVFTSPSTKPLSTLIEQVKPPEKKIEKGDIMATQENRAQVEIAKASNNKVPSDQHPRLANSTNHVETPQHAPILTYKTEDELTQISREEPRKLTSMDTSQCRILAEFDSLEDLMNDIKSRMFPTPNMSSIYTSESNMKKYMGSGNEDEPCIVYHYPKISNPEFTLQDNTCPLKSPQNKETGIAGDGTQTGPKMVQNDSSVTLREQVLNKETVCQFEQSLVEDDDTRDANKLNEKGIKPRIQKAVSKQLKRRIERRRNDVDCAEFGGKPSVANEKEVTEATQSKTLTEAITQGGNNQIDPNMYRKRLTDSASSPIEAKTKNTGQNIQEDTGILMDCTNECSRLKFQDFKCGEKFEEKLPTKNESNNKNETCDERENQAKDTIHKLRQDSSCQIDTMTICKELRVQLIDIASCNRKGETFEDALGKADNTGATTQHESSHGSKIVDLLVKQHEDWRDWSLKIDGESGLVLRNGKSIINAESMPMHLDSNECLEYLHKRIHLNKMHCFSSSKDNTMSMKKGVKEKLKRKTTQFDQFVAKKPRNQSKLKSGARKDKGQGLKSAKRLKISKDPKRLGTLQFIQMSSVSEDLPKYQYTRKEKSIQGGFRQKITISKQKRLLKMKRNLKNLKMSACYVRKMYAIERHYNQDIGDNLTDSVQLKSVQKSSKASSNKNCKAGMNVKQHVPIPVDKKKQWTHQQVSKKENCDNHDKCKGGRTIPSVKTPQEPQRQSTQVRHPEDLQKSSNAKKVRKQEIHPKRERKKKLPAKMATCHVPSLQDATESKDSRHYKQNNGNCGSNDRANNKEEAMLHQDLPQCSKYQDMFHLKDERSQKPATVNFSHSVKPKSIEKSSKASQNKNDKKGIHLKSFPPKKYKMKYQTEVQAGKGERSKKNDNRTMHSVKLPQDRKKINTLQINKCCPEDVSDPIEEDVRATMANLKQESHPKVKRQEKLLNKKAVSHDRNWQSPTDNQDPRPSNQHKGTCVSSDTANEKEETMSSQDLSQPSIDHLKAVSSQKPANLSLNKDFNKGMNSKKQMTSKKCKRKHQTQAKGSKGERSNEIDNRRTDRRTIPLFDLQISRNAPYRRKKYSNQRAKSTQNIGKRIKDVGYRKTNKPRLVDPNIHHANVEFTNPDYTAMCKHIEDSIKEDKAFQTITLSLVIPQDSKRLSSNQKCTKKPCTITFQDEPRDTQSCKADGTIEPRAVDPNIYHSNVEYTNPDCVEMCQRIDNLIKGDKAFKLPLEMTQDFKRLDSQTFTKKACTITSQAERGDLESDVIEAEKKKNQNQESKRDIRTDNGKAHKTTQPSEDLKRPSKPDCKMPRNTTYGKEKHSEKLKSSQYQKRRDKGCNNIDHRKALSISEFERDRERLLRRKNGRPYPDYIAKRRSFERSGDDGLHSGYKHERDPRNKCDDENDTNDGKPCRKRHRKEARNCQKEGKTTYELKNANHTIKERSTVTRQKLPDLKTTEIRNPRTLARRPRESQNARTNDPSASKPNLATSRPKEAAREGELNIDGPVKLDIKIGVFDINSQKIRPTIKGSIDSWFGLRIQTTPCKKQDAKKPIDKVQQIIFPTYCDAYSNLVFTEWGYVTQSMKRNSCPVLFFMHRNNTLVVTVYEHAIGLWACVTELSKSGEFQRKKCFIASVWQNDAKGRPFRGERETNYPFYLDDF